MFEGKKKGGGSNYTWYPVVLVYRVFRCHYKVYSLSILTNYVFPTYMYFQCYDI